jgi:hypothetical protein
MLKLSYEQYSPAAQSLSVAHERPLPDGGTA